MFKILALFALLSFAVCQSNNKNWAVLIAGSNGFYNYRHQADVCHAYQLLIANGFRAEHIIVFAYNDIAKSPSNPFPGQVFNKPSTGAGQDVYKGCVIDYQGADTTAANLISVLKGDEAAVKGKGTGKVLKSGRKDKIFINYSDHGAVGLVAMPVGGYLYADQLLEAFNFMFTHDMYDQLVFYLEACESGSMFVNLPKNMRIYATTAANPTESSWGHYCYPDDKVNGKNVGSCLGDEYSIQWMEDSDVADVWARTLSEQFETVKSKTQGSHVCKYGEETFTHLPIGHFQGHKETNFTVRASRFARRFRGFGKIGSIGAVDSRDIKLFYLMNKASFENTNENQEAVYDELSSRRGFDVTFEELAVRLGYVSSDLERPASAHNFACLRSAINMYENTCTKFTDYGLKYVKFLNTVCENPLLTQTEINSAISGVCISN